MSAVRKDVPAADVDLGRPATYFRLLAEHYVAVERMLAESEHAIQRVAENFRTQLPRRKLVLYVKRTKKPARRPRGLYWARAVKHGKRYHLPGGLRPSYLRFVGDNEDCKAAYYAFDDRRKSLNRAHKILANRSATLRAMLARRRLPMAAWQVDMTLVPSEFGRVGFDRALPLWSLSSAMAMTVVKLVALATQFAANGVPGFGLTFERDADHPFGRLRWRSDAGLHLPTPLRWYRLERGRIPRETSRALFAVERERRVLADQQQRLAALVRRYAALSARALGEAEPLIKHGLVPVKAEPPIGAILEARIRDNNPS